MTGAQFKTEFHLNPSPLFFFNSSNKSWPLSMNLPHLNKDYLSNSSLNKQSISNYFPGQICNFRDVFSLNQTWNFLSQRSCSEFPSLTVLGRGMCKLHSALLSVPAKSDQVISNTHKDTVMILEWNTYLYWLMTSWKFTDTDLQNNQYFTEQPTVK